MQGLYLREKCKSPSKVGKCIQPGDNNNQVWDATVGFQNVRNTMILSLNVYHI